MDRLGAELAGEKFRRHLFEFRRDQLRRQPAMRSPRDLAPLVPAGRAAGLGGHGSLRALGMGLVPGRGDASAAFRRLAPRRRRVARASRFTIRRPRLLARALRPHFAARGATPLGLALPRSYAAALAGALATAARGARAGRARRCSACPCWRRSPTTTSSKR